MSRTDFFCCVQLVRSFLSILCIACKSTTVVSDNAFIALSRSKYRLYSTQNVAGNVSDVSRTSCPQTLGDGNTDFGAVERYSSLWKRRRFVADAKNGRTFVVQLTQHLRQVSFIFVSRCTRKLTSFCRVKSIAFRWFNYRRQLVDFNFNLSR